MGNAGYGNHEDGAQSNADRPGFDLGGARDRGGGGQRSTPDPTGVGPHSGLKDPGSPTLSDDDRRQVATPGDGAGPHAPQGDEVDPGVG